MEPLAHLLDDGCEVGYCLGSEHGYACLAEVGNALEDWCGCEVTTCVEDSTVFVESLYVDVELLKEDIYLLVEGELLAREEPWAAEGGATYHDGIHSVAVEGLVGLVERADVTISYYRDVYAWIALYLAYEGPVGFACVHL